jgi:hypothetical protein
VLEANNTDFPDFMHLTFWRDAYKNHRKCRFCAAGKAAADGAPTTKKPRRMIRRGDIIFVIA